MDTTITKIVTLSETSGERERNQFVTPVKVKNECSYGTQKQDKEEQETSKRLESNHQRNESGFETSILQSQNSTVKKHQRRSFVG